MNESHETFSTPYGIRLDTRGVVTEIAAFMRADSSRNYTVMIGSDSQLLAGGVADFVTAIVVHRVGNGGRYFWRRLDHERVFNLRDRIIREALMSLDVARGVLEELKLIDVPHFDFEIHVDVGENGATKAVIQEVVGMVRANNFAVKTKPESYAASKVADRHV